MIWGKKLTYQAAETDHGRGWGEVRRAVTKASKKRADGGAEDIFFQTVAMLELERENRRSSRSPVAVPAEGNVSVVVRLPTPEGDEIVVTDEDLELGKGTSDHQSHSSPQRVIKQLPKTWLSLFPTSVLDFPPFLPSNSV